MNAKTAAIVARVRQQTPLIQAITNYVTVNDCANILLAYGASPAMVEVAEEAFGFAQISSAVYINLGTLTPEQALASVEACKAAKQYGVPVVLDPVGCGAIPRKNEIIRQIRETGRIDIIKGNAGEIKFLAGEQSRSRGVDSIDGGEGLKEATQRLAKEYGCVVVATGKEDIISNGDMTAVVENGVEMLTKITGAGCMLGALCAATAAVEPDPFLASIAGVVSMGVAGEMAYQESQLPGTFKVKLLDSIYLLNETILAKGGKIQVN